MMTITDSSITIKCLKTKIVLLVSITSTNDGSHPFITHVGLLTIFVKSEISHKSSSTCDLSGV
jgi:hypothetical protein